jgi:apolipoprotein N-acyltransferase
MQGVNVKQIGLSGLSGLMLTASFAPFNLEWIAWIAFLPLCMSLKYCSRANAFKLGLFTGIAHYITLLYWIIVATSRYGGIPLIPSLAILLLLVFYLALYPAFFALLFVIFIQNAASSFVGASIWVVLEYARTHMMTGFPWCLLGYSQFLRLPLIQIADITGVYGISFLVILVNLILYKAFFLLVMERIFKDKEGNWLRVTHFARHTHKGERITYDGQALRFLAVEMVIIICFLSATLIYGFHKLKTEMQSDEGQRQLRAVIVQGNIDQSIKWNEEFQQKTLAIYYTLSAQSADFKPHLIIWPETAVPLFFQDYSQLSQAVYSAARATDSKILFGSPAYEKKGNATHYFNRAYVLSKDRILDYYDKVHLTPFGEYVPLKRFLPFVHRIVQAAGDFTSGKGLKPLDAGDFRIGTLICYEAIFPEITRRLARQGTDLLVNITNDAWFGRTTAPYQHLSMAVLRCVETRLPMARAANTGISAFIIENGEILKQTGLFSRKVITERIKLRHRETFYSQFGDIFAILLSVITLTWLFWILMIKKEMRLCIIRRQSKS